MSRIKAVIFDCDGVLVDSEVLFHAVELEVLAEFGMVYESASFKARFLGMSDEAYYAALEQEARERLGYSVIESLRPRMRARVQEKFDTELRAVDGALAAVQALRLPKAVASSSSERALEIKLRRFDLWAPFAPHIYSAQQVAHAKPAPDLFLLAAQKLGVAPADCLVLEDSVHGVTAGRAAGMTVWSFGGGGHMDENLRGCLTDAGAVRHLTGWAEAQAFFAALG